MPVPADAPRPSLIRRPRLWVWVIVIVGLLGACLSWIVASPIGAGADEDWHLDSVWCPGPAGTTCAIVGHSPTGAPLIAVPQAIAASSSCIDALKSDDAHCPVPYVPNAMEATFRHNIGQYPGGYYHVMHLFVSDNYLGSVWAIRITNALLALGLIAALCCLLPPAWRRLLVYTIAATFVPLCFYTITSVNPSAWGIAGVLTVFFGLTGVFVGRTRTRRVALGALAVVGVVLSALSRADCAAMSALTAAAVAVIHLPRPRPLRPRAAAQAWRGLRGQLVALAAVFVVGVIGFLSAQQSEVLAPETGMALSAQGPRNITELGLLWHNITQLPLLLDQLWLPRLGYPDFWVSTLNGALGVGVALGLFVWGIAHRWTRRKLVAFLGVGFVTVALPLYVAQASFARLENAGLQGRYMAPLLIVVFAIAMMRRDATGADPLPPLPTLAAFGLLAAANCMALHTTIQRYVVDLAHPTLVMSSGVPAWPTGVGSPMFVWIAGSVAFAAALACLFAVRDAPARRAGRL